MMGVGMGMLRLRHNDLMGGCYEYVQCRPLVIAFHIEQHIPNRMIR